MPYLRFIKSFHFNSRPHGGRQRRVLRRSISDHISTHALTEGDLTHAPKFPSVLLFQLTPSRRATSPLYAGIHCTGYFNSRPHGGRPLFQKMEVQNMAFQLTPSRRATGRSAYESRMKKISTHALTEGDIRRSPITIVSCHFNSRPHGGRLPSNTFSVANVEFQLTPSRRATQPLFRKFPAAMHFNSRPHGGRRKHWIRCNDAEYFNSRPHGGRRQI